MSSRVGSISLRLSFASLTLSLNRHPLRPRTFGSPLRRRYEEVHPPKQPPRAQQALRLGRLGRQHQLFAAEVHCREGRAGRGQGGELKGYYPRATWSVSSTFVEHLRAELTLSSPRHFQPQLPRTTHYHPPPRRHRIRLPLLLLRPRLHLPLLLPLVFLLTPRRHRHRHPNRRLHAPPHAATSPPRGARLDPFAAQERRHEGARLVGE